METRDAQLLVRILAGINAALAAIGLIGILLAATVLRLPGIDEILQAFGSVVLFIVGLWVLFVLVASMMAMKFVPWARIAMIIIGVVNLLNFPLGTLIGVANIYVFGFHEDAKRLFRRQAIPTVKAPARPAKKAVKKAPKKK
jgi:hypothetical protein